MLWPHVGKPRPVRAHTERQLRTGPPRWLGVADGSTPAISPEVREVRNGPTVVNAGWTHVGVFVLTFSDLSEAKM